MATNTESATDDSSCKVPSAAPKEICLIDAHINSLFEVRLYPGLKSVNLHCNNISVIENLSRLRHLTHLDLSSNHIRRIEGLAELNSLKSLNLSCNELHIVEGLENLRNLTSLDLSYNMVNNLSGLKSLHGPGFSLTFLYLHGNQLRSLDHVINCTVGCHNLKELSLSRYGESNPVCENVGYRTKVLAALKMLDVLDGLDRFGNLSATKGGLFSFPELDGYMEYLQSTSSSESANLKPDHRYELVTPKIDVVLDRFRQRGPLSSETDPGEDIGIEEPITLAEQSHGRVSLSADHEVRLETLEHQISHLIHNTDKVQVAKKSRKGIGNSNSDESDESGPKKPVMSSPKHEQSRQVPVSKRVQSKRRSKPSVKVTMDTSSSTSPTDDQGRKYAINGKALKGRPVRDPEDDATVLSLMQELDAERERRWKAEQAARRMVDVIKELQLKESDECKLREASLAASSRLKRALLKEKEKNATLQTAFTELQAQKSELSGELHRLKETEVNQQKTLRAMEQTATKMETEKMRQHAEAFSQLQKEQMKAGALSKETALLKHSVKQLKAQVHQLQELLANREQEHRMAAEGLVRIDSPEVRALVDREVAKQNICHQQVVNQLQERLNKRDLEYASLEDEFRMALQIEANRFRELQEAFERLSDDCAQQKEALQTIRQKESKASGIVNELTAVSTKIKSQLSSLSMLQMVKEQRGRITELSRGRQEIIGDYKERLQTVEKQLSEANKQLTRLEVLEQDKAKLSAQIRAQGSVIEGLRSERKLWGEELAQQGASLAQDRGRMESRIEALTSEISEVKKECQNAHETVSIKSKIIEDQTDSIRKLKQKIADQDAEGKNLEEENRTRERHLEEQLATESTANQELQEQLDALLDRKESLKQELSKTQGELQTSRENHRTLKAKWQERSELIGKLEKEVVEMRNTFKEKENKLSEERDKAITAANSAVEKLKACDDAFRKQLEQQRQTHQQQVDKLTREKQQEIEQVNAKVLEVEDEMRMLLQENALTKKTLEQRLKKLTTAFTEMQHDLAST